MQIKVQHRRENQLFSTIQDKNMIYRILLSALLAVVSISVHAQNPGDPVWGVYASGIGEIINPNIDPCDITYKVAAMDNKRILQNLSAGTMVMIDDGLTWNEAGVVSRWSGQYFEDQPDGQFKTRPCRLETTLEDPPLIVRRNRPNMGRPGGNPPNIGPDISGTWVFGDGGESWTFTAIGGNRYEAQENGYGNAFGTATVNGNSLHIDFECPNRKCKGTYGGKISQDGRSINATRSDGRRFTFTRGNPPNIGLDISGTWVFGDGGESWTFTAIGGNRYEAQENGYGNAFGTATVNGNSLHIDFECPNRKCKGTYGGKISQDGRSINATRSDGRRFTFTR